MSLPSRERGLKSEIILSDKKTLQSLPSRERGLKCEGCSIASLAGRVAPLAGARIEIFDRRSCPCTCRVAPLAGARIEIAHTTWIMFLTGSRSPRGSAD